MVPVNSRLLKISGSSCSEHVYDENKAEWPQDTREGQECNPFLQYKRGPKGQREKTICRRHSFGSILLQILADRGVAKLETSVWNLQQKQTESMKALTHTHTKL